MSIATQLNRIKSNVYDSFVALEEQGVTLSGDESSNVLAELIQTLYNSGVSVTFVSYDSALLGIFAEVNRVQVNILNALRVFEANGVDITGMNSDNLPELIRAIEPAQSASLFSLIDNSGNTIVDNSGNYLVSDVEPIPSVTSDIEGNVLTDEEGQALVSDYV